MNAQEIIMELNARGIVLSLNGDNLNYKAKPGAFTTALKDSIREHKQEIILFLQAQQAGPDLRAVLKNDGWSREMIELIYWAYTADLPNKPFSLHAGGFIQDYKGFYRQLINFIAQGSAGEQAQNGNLQRRLIGLKKVTATFLV